jgi:ribosomal protein L29
MATKRKTSTKQDLESKIAELEAKLTKLSTQLEAKPAEPKPAQAKPAETKPAQAKPAETKPAEVKKPTLPKGSEPKPAEVPKPAEAAKQLPTTFNEALEDAYYTAPMSDFHKYRANVTGYSPAPNRYFVRKTAPVGKVPTTNWNDQKIKVSGYTAASNQYFATRARMAYHPADKTFGTFGGVKMTVEGVAVQEKAQEPPKEAPKPKGTLPKGVEQTQSPPANTTTKSKSKAEQLEEYERDYLQRIEQDRIEQQNAYEEELRREAADSAARPQTSASSTRGSLPKGFEPQPEPEKPKSSRGTLPKGF